MYLDLNWYILEAMHIRTCTWFMLKKKKTFVVGV